MKGDVKQGEGASRRQRRREREETEKRRECRDIQEDHEKDQVE